MAISPPSDIVLDVARAVEPSAVDTARAELLRKARGAAAEPFTVAEAAASRSDPSTSSETGAPQEFSSIVPGTLSRSASSGSMPDAAKKFEAMVLQTFISSMLPKNASGTYGAGMAGEMWKSMMAEKIANVVAEGGGIGIAKSVLGDFHVDGETKVPVGAVAPQANAEERRQTVATALVDQMQRRLTSDLIGTNAEAGGLFKARDL